VAKGALEAGRSGNHRVDHDSNLDDYNSHERHDHDDNERP